METTTLQNDIKLLTLASLLTQATTLVKEIKGIDYIYISEFGASVEIKPELGRNSLLCFIAGEKSYNSDKATCKVSDDISISFKIPAKPVVETTNQDAPVVIADAA